jgi:hypothetical protein
MKTLVTRCLTTAGLLSGLVALSLSASAQDKMGSKMDKMATHPTPTPTMKMDSKMMGSKMSHGKMMGHSKMMMSHGKMTGHTKMKPMMSHGKMTGHSKMKMMAGHKMMQSKMHSSMMMHGKMDSKMMSHPTPKPTPTSKMSGDKMSGH